jgi:hypothetical protein
VGFSIGQRPLRSAQSVILGRRSPSPEHRYLFRKMKEKKENESTGPSCWHGGFSHCRYAKGDERRFRGPRPAVA